MKKWEKEIEQELKACKTTEDLYRLYAKYIDELYQYLYGEKDE